MRLNVGDKQNNSFCLILWLGLNGFEKKRARREEEEEEGGGGVQKSGMLLS